MAKLIHNCPTCSKPADIQVEIPMGNLINYVYRCGHIELREKLTPVEETISAAENKIAEIKTIDPLFYSLDKTKKAYDFQIDGVHFIENAGLTGAITDELGLGKTIQALLLIKRNKQHMIPCLIIVKSAIIFQWAIQLKSWASEHPLGVMPITSRDNIIPGFGCYIISRDLLSRKGILERLFTLNLKSIIVDECHAFKDDGAARTRALIKLIEQNAIQHRIFLSGTPIKNRADEYFTTLNLIAPEHFRSRDRFRKNWLIQNEKGQWSRVNPYYLDDFKKLISKWIIRREKCDVFKDLPKLSRDYQYVEIEDEAIKKSYNAQLTLFGNFLKNEADIKSQDILGWLAKLRSITGQAKCQNAIDWAQDFLDSSDGSLAIGIQHRAVRDTLYYVFDAAGYSPLKYSGEDSAYAKERIKQQFISGLNRLLIINMIAGGEGVDGLQRVCSNSLVLERQWNAADEEQFEGRFHRDGQTKPVMMTYMIARGTIDEWFHNLVEKKRQIFGETISNSWSLTTDDSSLMDLAEQTIANKL